MLERHQLSGAVGCGFVAGLGIKGGAVACTVNHDSHNIFTVGDNHESMAVAANALAEAGGGYCAVVGTEVRALAALPIAGLLSDQPLAPIRASSKPHRCRSCQRWSDQERRSWAITPYSVPRAVSQERYPRLPASEG